MERDLQVIKKVIGCGFKSVLLLNLGRWGVRAVVHMSIIVLKHKMSAVALGVGNQSGLV